MECWEERTYVAYLLDNEIDRPTRILIKDHLATCEQCKRIFEFQQRMRQMLKNKMKRVPAPPTLRERILAQIDQVERKERWHEPFWQRYVIPKIWVPAFVGLLLLGAFLWMADIFSSAPSLVQESVNHLVRYHTQRPLEGIYSTDATEIREWLNARLTFSVPVPAIEGLTLVGGWVETVEDQKAAHILYQKGNQIFSLLIRPEEGQTPSFPVNRQVGTRSLYVGHVKGYTAVLWQDKGIVCAFVGNLPEKEVLQYALKAMPI